MKNYLSPQDFISFLSSLEENKSIILHAENIEYGSVEDYYFMKLQFVGETVTLYTTSYGGIGIIRDTPIATWEEDAELVFEDLEHENEYKLFIEE